MSLCGGRASRGERRTPDRRGTALVGRAGDPARRCCRGYGVGARALGGRHLGPRHAARPRAALPAALPRASRQPGRFPATQLHRLQRRRGDARMRRCWQPRCAFRSRAAWAPAAVASDRVLRRGRCPTNQVHQWAHMPSPPRLVRWLQARGVILGRRGAPAASRVAVCDELLHRHRLVQSLADAHRLRSRASSIWSRGSPARRARRASGEAVVNAASERARA